MLLVKEILELYIFQYVIENKKLFFWVQSSMKQSNDFKKEVPVSIYHEISIVQPLPCTTSSIYIIMYLYYHVSIYHPTEITGLLSHEYSIEIRTQKGIQH